MGRAWAESVLVGDAHRRSHILDECQMNDGRKSLEKKTAARPAFIEDSSASR